MPRSLLYRLLPLAAVAVICVVLAAKMPPKADASVSSVTASPASIVSGGSSTITVNAEDNVGSLAISVTGAATQSLTITNCVSGTGVVTAATCTASSTGNGTALLTIFTSSLNDNGGIPTTLAVTLTLTATCTAAANITVSASDNTSGGQAFVSCTASSTWISVSAASLNCGGTAIVSALPPDIGLGTAIVFSATSGTFTPASVSYGGTTVTSTFTAPTTSTTTLATITVTAGSVTGTAQITISCTGATTMTVSAAPSSVTCGSASFITATGAGAGATVVLSTTLGTLAPASATDNGSGVLSVLTAPQSQSGTATITAASGDASGSATVAISCSSSVPTVAPVAPQPISGIRPPSTGDGGLRPGASPWRTALGLGLIAALLTGSFGAARSRSLREG